MRSFLANYRCIHIYKVQKNLRSLRRLRNANQDGVHALPICRAERLLQALLGVLKAGPRMLELPAASRGQLEVALPPILTRKASDPTSSQQGLRVRVNVVLSRDNNSPKCPCLRLPASSRACRRVNCVTRNPDPHSSRS